MRTADIDSYRCRISIIVLTPPNYRSKKTSAVAHGKAATRRLGKQILLQNRGRSLTASKI